MADLDAFTIRRIATSGAEIRDLDGRTGAWTVTEP